MLALGSAFLCTAKFLLLAAVPQHTGVDKRFQLRSRLANKCVQRRHVGPARFFEFCEVFRWRGDLELLVHASTVKRSASTGWPSIADQNRDRPEPAKLPASAGC